MSQALFSLVKTNPVDILRHGLGTYVNGDLVEGAETVVPILANIHPFSDYQVMLLPESDRSRSWMWLFTSSMVQQKKEGEGGNGADRFIWQGDTYEVMKVQTYSMTIRDHYEAKCCRIELTPN